VRYAPDGPATKLAARCLPVILAKLQLTTSAATSAGGADCTIRLWSVSQQGVIQNASTQDTAAAADANGVAQPSSDGVASHGGGGGGNSRADRAGSLACLRTKATPVVAVQFSRRNLLLGAGTLTAWPDARRKAVSPALTQ